jgi:O-antigen ligase
LFGIYSTLTRSVWMGAGLGLFVILALSVPGRWRYGVVVSAVLAGIIVPVVGWDNLMVFKREKGVEAEVSADSAKLRPILAAVAWKMFQERPLLGCGYGQYSNEMTAYLSDRSLDMPLETARPYVQHNVFLGLLTETGLIGMTLFAALLAYWAWAAWLLWSHPHATEWMRLVGLLFLATLGAYLPNAMFHDMSLIPMVNMSLFFLAGASTGLSVRAGRAPNYRIVTPADRPLDEPQLVG